MNILLSNDDGIYAQGIQTLYRYLTELGDVTTIAPDRNCSGASNSLTLVNPLRVQPITDNSYSVNGTPTDCVHIGINQLIKPEPDLVVSGINHGANLADDVIYSGTVAAATEGRHMGLPAIAVSLVGKEHFDSAAKATIEIIKNLSSLSLPDNQILNINVPDLPYEQIKGFKVTRCGARHRAESMTKSKDPYGRDIYWYGPQGPEQDDGDDTDFAAIKQGYVSITPLSVDMTAHRSIDPINTWLQSFHRD